MNHFLFCQTNAFERLNLVRISLCSIVILLLLLGPYDSFYVETAPYLFKAQRPFQWFPNLGIHFWTLKFLTIATAICFGFLPGKAISGPFLAVLFLFFNYYVTCFSTTYWITNTHLNFFAIALCFVPNTKKNQIEQKEMASFILAFMITYVAVLYFQAGLSKLLSGGFGWFFNGQRIWTETILLGTAFGKWLTQWPWIFTLMSLFTGVFELILPFFFFFDKTRFWNAWLAILFHLGTFAVMGISFWFLWALYPALFFYKPKKDYLLNAVNACNRNS
jgi:hypothetical protein